MSRPDAATADPFERVRAAKYVLLTTFKRDGTPVPTPVWAVPVETPEGRAIRIWTSRRTGKVKRVRNSGRVEVAPCTVRGKPLGATVAGTARLLDADGSRETVKALRKKYGVLARLLTVRVERRLPDFIGIEVVERADQR